MGVYAHATHVYVPDIDTGRVIAGALLKSPHSLAISKPYGKWINVYLEMGLSYKDCLEFPTAAHIELNVYNSEGFDLRLFAQDRLAFLYENGAGDVGEEEEQLMEIAADLWEKENPEAAKAAKDATRSRMEGSKTDVPKTDAEPSKEALGFLGLSPEEQQEWVKKSGASEEDEEALSKAADLWAKENPEKAAAAKAAASASGDTGESIEAGDGTVPGFWGLPEPEQEKYLSQARQSGVFRKYVNESQIEDDVPSCDPFKPYLPEGTTPQDLHRLLKAMQGRLHGPPNEETEKALLEKWMDGKNHSDRAEDYIAAISRFFGLKGSLWSIESITEQLSDHIAHRIVGLEHLEQTPKSV